MIINTHTEHENAKSRETAYFVYMLGDLVGTSVARLFDSKNKYPKIYDVFPEHFDEPDEQEDWMKLRDRLVSFANKHNHQMKVEAEYKAVMAQRAREDAEKKKRLEGKA